MTDTDDLLRLENQLCFAVVTAARNVVAIYRPILEPLGLTHPQYLVMLALWERAPRTLNDLAADLALEPATASPSSSGSKPTAWWPASAAARTNAGSRSRSRTPVPPCVPGRWTCRGR